VPLSFSLILSIAEIGAWISAARDSHTCPGVGAMKEDQDEGSHTKPKVQTLPFCAVLGTEATRRICVPTPQLSMRGRAWHGRAPTGRTSRLRSAVIACTVAYACTMCSMSSRCSPCCRASSCRGVGMQGISAALAPSLKQEAACRLLAIQTTAVGCFGCRIALGCARAKVALGTSRQGDERDSDLQWPPIC